LWIIALTLIFVLTGFTFIHLGKKKSKK
jgi:hypothetical protein